MSTQMTVWQFEFILREDFMTGRFEKMATSWDIRHPCIDDDPKRSRSDSSSSDTFSRTGVGK